MSHTAWVGHFKSLVCWLTACWNTHSNTITVPGQNSMFTKDQVTKYMLFIKRRPCSPLEFKVK